MRARHVLATIGATIFTDIAALLVLAVCVSIHVKGAFSIADLAGMVGAFLRGIAINQVLSHGPARDKLEFIGKTFFVPIFLVLVGVRLDLPGFVNALSTGLPFVLAIVLALFAGKLIAAISPRQG